LDKNISPDAENVNVVIIRLSRLNVIGGEEGNLGYGAGFKKEDCVISSIQP